MAVEMLGKFLGNKLHFLFSLFSNNVPKQIKFMELNIF